MICERCSGSNPEGALRCARCASLLAAPRAPAAGDPAASAAATAAPEDPAFQALLQELADVPAPPVAPAMGLGAGAELGPRYEIVKLLGRGGMGAVYLARDRELARLVAVKLIAPHLSLEAGVVDRFRREIHLSSIVTHPNVLRVFDIGEHDGVKFLTMQYVQGETLAALVRRERRLPLGAALALFRQICAGLAAAHEKGVTHRDLKPQNVLVDEDGNAFLTDFGLATAGSVAALTQTGAVLGTPDYMSPEQVKGEPTDPRSDVFSAGVMLYELLTGELPFGGDGAYAAMLARTRGPARPVSHVNAGVPPEVQRVVERCLAREPAQRYASAAEVLRALEHASPAAPRGRAGLPGRRRWRWGAAGLAALGIAAAALVAWRASRPPAAAPRALTVLVADFDNRTGEGVFASALEPALALALEGAAFVTAHDRAAAREAADERGLPGQALAEPRARAVAREEGVGAVAAGYVERSGAGYEVGVRLVDVATGEKLAEARADAPDRAATLAAVALVAAQVRGALGDGASAEARLEEGRTAAAASLEAAHAHGVASELGRRREARARYLEALRLDPGMARAHAGLALLEPDAPDAEAHYEAAVRQGARLTERERQRTRGRWLLSRGDAAGAVEAFGALVAAYPADAPALAGLAAAHALRGEAGRALELGRRAAAVYPRSAAYRSEVGFFALYAGDPAAAAEAQRAALAARPRLARAHAGLALAQAASGAVADAQATWRALEALGAAAAPAAAEGLADLAALEGRVRDAQALLSAGIRGDLAAGEPDAAARKLAMAAELSLAARDGGQASALARRALGASRALHPRFLAALALASAGDVGRAEAVADELGARAEAVPRALAETIRGAVHLHRREYARAIERLRSGLERHDTWIARLLLGRAYLQAGALEQARDELETCERRRAEAADLPFEGVPTWRLYAAVPYHLGRAREALGSPAAADTYRAFLALKKGDGDPAVADARRRLAALERR